MAIGEATKLVRWLTADDKAYRAKLELGVETDTLDAEGAPTERAPVPDGLTAERILEVGRSFLGTHLQRAPAFSAIKVNGQALHQRARRGEQVEAPEREVKLQGLRVEAFEGASVELELEVAKGFYVRSFVRDLARALGTRGHLTALRRVRSGPWGLDESVDGESLARATAGDADARAALRARTIGLARACGEMPRLTLSARGAQDALHGRPIAASSVDHGLTHLNEGAEPLALVDGSGALVAVGGLRQGRVHVIRGFRFDRG